MGLESLPLCLPSLFPSLCLSLSSSPCVTDISTWSAAPEGTKHAAALRPGYGAPHARRSPAPRASSAPVCDWNHCKDLICRQALSLFLTRQQLARLCTLSRSIAVTCSLHSCTRHRHTFMRASQPRTSSRLMLRKSWCSSSGRRLSTCKCGCPMPFALPLAPAPARGSQVCGSLALAAAAVHHTQLLAMPAHACLQAGDSLCTSTPEVAELLAASTMALRFVSSSCTSPR